MSDTQAEIALGKAAASVAEWHSNIGMIATKIETAKRKLAELEETRRNLALKAAMGDTAATEAVLEARGMHAATSLEAEDFAAALIDAKGKLSEAQGIHAAASRARTREIAAEIISRRIAAAKRFDEHAQGMADAHRDFSDIVDELGALPNFDGFGDAVIGISRRENVMGRRRVESALPAFCGALDATRASSASLFRSESLVWQGYK